MTGTGGDDDRVYWADTAKGLIILIIVLSHGGLFVEGAGYPQATLRNAIGAVTPVGMPLFFMISGMFSRRYLDGSWSGFWHGRLKALIWVLLIWIPIDWLLFSIFPNFRDPTHGKHLWQILTAWIFPSSYLWFIWSLGAYSLLAWLLGRRHAKICAAAALAVTLAMLGLTTWHLDHYGLHLLAQDYYLRGALSFFFYFYFGYVCRDLILRAATLPTVPATVVALVGYGVLAWIASTVTSVAPGAVIKFVAVGVGMVGAIYLGKTLGVRRDTRRFFGRLGQMTLPIYLTHLLFMMPLVYWLASLHSPYLLGSGVALAIAVSIISILGSVAITQLAIALNLTFFFFPPKLRLLARIAALFGRGETATDGSGETPEAEARS
ncbi:acyltransferase [Sphingomonas gei]|uniref:Acyltransferase n=1 Tax=Sphingomonas gei TaxID=1395960 RepID=A0A4S1XBM9_9SPHN|nr:acyltransferase [Sphingomonas gei]TGX53501.1 acyltransferase [Sphingomonas gei]